MLKFHCTNCSYIYNPYFWDPEKEIDPPMDFYDLPETWTCPWCYGVKDDFIEIDSKVIEPSTIENMLPEEERHMPFYFERDWSVVVKIWTEDEQFEESEDHFIEFVWIYDEDFIEIDRKDLPDITEEIIFDIPDCDVYEVRASCSMHWIWRWVFIWNNN